MRQLFLFQKKNSGLIARNRLKLILVSDEMNCRPGIIDSIREDLARVLSRYAEFDPMAMKRNQPECGSGRKAGYGNHRGLFHCPDPVPA